MLERLVVHGVINGWAKSLRSSHHWAQPGLEAVPGEPEVLPVAKTGDVFQYQCPLQPLAAF